MKESSYRHRRVNKGSRNRSQRVSRNRGTSNVEIFANRTPIGCIPSYLENGAAYCNTEPCQQLGPLATGKDVRDSKCIERVVAVCDGPPGAPCFPQTEEGERVAADDPAARYLVGSSSGGELSVEDREGKFRRIEELDSTHDRLVRDLAQLEEEKTRLVAEKEGISTGNTWPGRLFNTPAYKRYNFNARNIEEDQKTINSKISSIKSAIHETLEEKKGIRANLPHSYNWISPRSIVLPSEDAENGIVSQRCDDALCTERRYGQCIKDAATPYDAFLEEESKALNDMEEQYLVDRSLVNDMNIFINSLWTTKSSDPDVLISAEEAYQNAKTEADNAEYLVRDQRARLDSIDDTPLKDDDSIDGRTFKDDDSIDGRTFKDDATAYFEQTKENARMKRQLANEKRDQSDSGDPEDFRELVGQGDNRRLPWSDPRAKTNMEEQWKEGWKRVYLLEHPEVVEAERRIASFKRDKAKILKSYAPRWQEEQDKDSQTFKDAVRTSDGQYELFRPGCRRWTKGAWDKTFGGSLYGMLLSAKGASTLRHDESEPLRMDDHFRNTLGDEHEYGSTTVQPHYSDARQEWPDDAPIPHENEEFSSTDTPFSTLLESENSETVGAESPRRKGKKSRRKSGKKSRRKSGKKSGRKSGKKSRRKSGKKSRRKSGKKSRRRSGKKSRRKSGKKSRRRSGKKSRRKSGKKSRRRSGKKSRRKSGKKSRRRSGKKSRRKSGKKSRRKSGKKSRRKSGKKSRRKSGKKSRRKSGKKSRRKSGKKSRRKSRRKVSNRF